ncbi:MAG: Holliday junction resolvase RuvX [Oscillospiraceae bacterium]|nr:Holliday junction resolvase RuvX [Oscillospiraceae bacterium]
MRIMALDYGDARTGAAISDAAGTLTGFTAVIRTRDMAQAARQAARLAEEHGAERLVLGFPRNMDGTEGLRAGKYREFAALLERESGLEVALWDERRTTVEAHAILRANGRRTRAHRENVDAVAATLILEGYLQFLKNQPQGQT